MRAAWYVVLARRRAGSPWEELPARFLDLDAAIEHARHALRSGGAAAGACVQGRGTPDHPTPVGQTTPWSGVRAGFSADAFFGGASGRASESVEVVS